jgi:1,4-alpha-glucan branching enzyme
MSEARRRKSRTLLTKDDLYLFNEGTHNRLFDRLGAHPRTLSGESGYNFAVWAPNAEAVSVLGDFNGWSPDAHPLSRVGESGIWDGFVPGVQKGAKYKFRIIASTSSVSSRTAADLPSTRRIPSGGTMRWHRRRHP